MISKANWKAWVIMGAAVALFVTSGGLLMASNMGFKINTALQNGFVAPGPKGDNWRALPWNSPNTTYTALCNTFGSAGATKGNINLTTIAAGTGTPTNVNCAIGSNTLIPVGGGIRIRVNGTTAPTSPANIVLVGSSNETAAFPTIQGGFVAPGPKGDNWIAPPYHTTWTKASEVCASFGMGAGSGNITRIEGTTGVPTTFSCGLTANNFTLIIGEAIRIRKTTAGNVVGTLPPHF